MRYPTAQNVLRFFLSDVLGWWQERFKQKRFLIRLQALALVSWGIKNKRLVTVCIAA